MFVRTVGHFNLLLYFKWSTVGRQCLANAISWHRCDFKVITEASHNYHRIKHALTDRSFSYAPKIDQQMDKNEWKSETKHPNDWKFCLEMKSGSEKSSTLLICLVNDWDSVFGELGRLFGRLIPVGRLVAWLVGRSVGWSAGPNWFGWLLDRKASQS